MPSDTIRILLVDDQSLFREGLRTLIGTQPDFQVVGEAANGEEALRLVETTRPEVVLMDVRMPVLDGVAATRRLRSSHPEVRVIVLTTFDDDESVFDGLRAGALGYLLKDTPSDRLFEAIRAAARGESFLQPSVAAKVVAEFQRLTATTARRGQDTAECRRIGEVEGTGELAEQLGMAQVSVRHHLDILVGEDLVESSGVRRRNGAGGRRGRSCARWRRVMPSLRTRRTPS